MPRISLTRSHPALASQWHPHRNGELTSDDVTAGSKTKAWWRCEHGHDWQARVDSRKAGSGCPFCAGQRAEQGTSLAVRYPALVAQWHPDRNGELTAADVLPTSKKRVWWRCEHDHDWQTPVYARTNGNGCPYCAGRKATVDSSLAALHPELAAQWHQKRNGDLTAADVRPGADRKVWWQCARGHEYDAFVYRRVAGDNCPFCSGKRAGKQNSLATLRPEIASQWHPDKNGELTADTVTVSSNKKVWWVCAEGHEWPAAVYSRTKGTGCPHCTGRKPGKAPS